MGIKIAYQGEPGAFSDEAVTALFPDAQATGFSTFRLTFDALEMGAVDAAVLPVENSSAGVVQEVSDLLWELPGLRIVRDHVQPVRHCLLGWPGPVERALSHPQALAQCERYLHSRQIRPVTFHDTAGAARAVAEQRQPDTAAIASKAAAARYGLYVLAESIQDDSENRTRFVVVERGEPTRPGAATTSHGASSQKWKGSIAFVTAHRPGSLAHALDCFARRGVNLTRLDSRPMMGKPFEYRFYLDFSLNGEATAPADAEAALTDLEEAAAQIKLFGTYPAA
ncbi:MAG TPA: prephenate dehydratase domain-containing protein [Candidatus Dormibacteraeota bacterium]|nr:prephenate dehydratase domain-containing protein [Candidatus Dormibacteraeota bacterium]